MLLPLLFLAVSAISASGLIELVDLSEPFLPDESAVELPSWGDWSFTGNYELGHGSLTIDEGGQAYVRVTSPPADAYGVLIVNCPGYVMNVTDQSRSSRCLFDVLNAVGDIVTSLSVPIGSRRSIYQPRESSSLVFQLQPNKGRSFFLRPSVTVRSLGVRFPSYSITPLVTVIPGITPYRVTISHDDLPRRFLLSACPLENSFSSGLQENFLLGEGMQLASIPFIANSSSIVGIDPQAIQFPWYIRDEDRKSLSMLALRSDTADHDISFIYIETNPTHFYAQVADLWYRLFDSIYTGHLLGAIWPAERVNENYPLNNWAAYNPTTKNYGGVYYNEFDLTYSIELPMPKSEVAECADAEDDPLCAAIITRGLRTPDGEFQMQQVDDETTVVYTVPSEEELQKASEKIATMGSNVVVRLPSLAFQATTDSWGILPRPCYCPLQSVDLLDIRSCWVSRSLALNTTDKRLIVDASEMYPPHLVSNTEMAVISWGLATGDLKQLVSRIQQVRVALGSKPITVLNTDSPRYFRRVDVDALFSTVAFYGVQVSFTDDFFNTSRPRDQALVEDILDSYESYRDAYSALDGMTLAIQRNIQYSSQQEYVGPDRTTRYWFALFDTDRRIAFDTEMSVFFSAPDTEVTQTTLSDRTFTVVTSGTRLVVFTVKKSPTMHIVYLVAGIAVASITVCFLVWMTVCCVRRSRRCKKQHGAPVQSVDRLWDDEMAHVSPHMSSQSDEFRAFAEPDPIPVVSANLHFRSTSHSPV